MQEKFKLEKNRLKKVANRYNPQNQRIEDNIINYRLNVMMPMIKGKKVLEMGCSTGVMTKRLIKKFPTLTVVDGSRKYIEYVKKTTKEKRAKFIISLFEDFETKEKFDDIIIANALEHVENPVYILKKAKNWLNKNGRIHIIVPNAYSLHRIIGCKIGLIKKITDFSKNDKKIGHRRVYTTKSLEKDIRMAGLKIMSHKGIFLKPLSHAQMNNWDKKILDAFFQISDMFSDYCSSIYFICKRR